MSTSESPNRHKPEPPKATAEGRNRVQRSEVIKLFGQGATTRVVNLDPKNHSLVCIISGHGPEFSDTLALSPTELTIFHAIPSGDLLSRRVVFADHDLVDLCRGKVDYSSGKLSQAVGEDPNPLDCVVLIYPSLTQRRRYWLSVFLNGEDKCVLAVPISRALLDEVIRPWGHAVYDGGEFRWPRWLFGAIGPHRHRF